MSLKAVIDVVGDFVSDVTATSPVVSSGGDTPDISLLGLVGLGTANQYIAVNDAGTALTYVTAGAGGVTNVTATAPLTSSGGATPTVAINGISALGTTLQVMAVNTGATAMEWVSCTGTTTFVRSLSPALTGTATVVNMTASGTVAIGTTRVSNVSLRVLSNALTGGVQAGVVINPTFTTSAISAGETLEVTFATAAGSFTMANGYAIRILAPTIGAGSTVTNLYGLKVEDQGATRSAIKTGTGKHEFGSSSGSTIGFFGTAAIAKPGPVTIPPTTPFANAISDNVTFQASLNTLTSTVGDIYANLLALGLMS